ncbi:MAG TPA: hypothetical protein VF483_14205, partial [Gemmatimonadaceae bacterium]
GRRSPLAGEVVVTRISERFLCMCVVSLAVSACGRDSTAVEGATVVTLTEAQAAALVSKAQTMSTSSSDLAWLTDSIEVVLRAGEPALKVTITVDSVAKSYYAVGLMRQFATANPFSTFHFIAFNDATNPTDFVLANAYSPATDSTAPNSTLGTFGGANAFGHIVHVSGSTVVDQVAHSGSALFQRVETGAACPGFVASVTVSCASATMLMQLNISFATSVASFGDTHTATTGVPIVPAVLLTFH